MRCGVAALAVVAAGFGLPMAGAAATRQAETSANQRRLSAARAWVSLSDLAAHTGFLASDALHGRAPGTPGGAATAQYIAAQFERIGLEPAASNGSYFQSMPLLGITPSPVVMVAMGATTFSLNYPSDFVARPERADTFLLAGGELAFVGHGVHAPEDGWDDFKDTPLNGRVLLMLPGVPETFAGPASYASEKYKIEEAVRRGATGVLFVHSGSMNDAPWPVLRNRWTREHVRPLETQNVSLDFTGWVTNAAAKRIFAQAGVDWDVLVRRASLKEFRPVDVGAHVGVDIESDVRSFDASNVVGRIRGSEVPERSVLVTAHYDYLGVRRGASSDSIFNGARANAATLSGLLTMAGALAAAGVVAPTTLEFVAVTGGESGAFGLQSYLWDLSRSRESPHAAIVIEEANLWGPTSDIVIGGREDIHRDGTIVAAAAAEGLTAVGDAQRANVRVVATAATHEVLTSARVPYATISAGAVLPDNAPSARELAIASYYDRHYGRTSDNLDAGFDYRGLQSQIRFAIRLAWSLAQLGATPTN